MKNKLTQDMEIILNNFSQNEITLKYQNRIREMGLTKDENINSHFCVCFAAFDSESRQVFMGHHKKSGFWLFNGGHIKKDEGLEESLRREIVEEWGLSSSDFKVMMPELLTMTEINNSPKQGCKSHFDIWYFIDMDKNEFKPNKVNLHEEFYLVKWMDLDMARKMSTSKSTLEAFDYLEKKYFKYSKN